jgi:hypothetical protein
MCNKIFFILYFIIMNTEDFKNKLSQIKEANDKIFGSLLKDTEIYNNIIFVYTPPKVGSTTLVSSIRISASHKFSIIHIHDEIMLTFFTGINSVTINEIIQYNSYIGKNVFVIDIYRTPIERKMSEFFEKISPYHFNNSEENINNYSVKRITERFNKVFPYLALGDHYIDKYNIPIPQTFDYTKNFLFIKNNNINYIKLRLKDSDNWGKILSEILCTEIIIISDYETNNKVIGKLYSKFKNDYKIPINYLEIIKNDKYLRFYYSNEEINSYLNLWNNKLTEPVLSYTQHEYLFYVNLNLENQIYNDVQSEHYIDNGCLCKGCSLKRKDIFEKAKKGIIIKQKINHIEVVNQIIENKNKLINKIVDKINNKNKNKNNLKSTLNTNSSNKIKSNLMTSCIGMR